METELSCRFQPVDPFTENDVCEGRAAATSKHPHSQTVSAVWQFAGKFNCQVNRLAPALKTRRLNNHRGILTPGEEQNAISDEAQPC